MKVYPEHEKMMRVYDDAQVIGDFLEGLAGQGLMLAEVVDSRGLHVSEVEVEEMLVPAHKSIQQVIADHYKIDLDKIEVEKRMMLDDIRKANNGTDH